MVLEAADVEALERATFDAVPPQALDLLDGWLLGFDRGTVGRAHSAVPASHDASSAAADPRSVGRVMAAYAARGLRPAFRVPGLPAFDAVRAELGRRGHAGGKPTRVFTAHCDAFAGGDDAMPAELMPQPDQGWRDVFLGEGFDPVDGASRVEILGRARHAVFACVRAGGQTVAAGMGSFSHGWASVHGMRTLPAHRGQGMAGSILSAIAREAAAREAGRAFLQVEAGNTGAQALYLRRGFAPVWDYAYWYPRSA